MSSLTIVELTESNTCKICDNAVGKYSCPKCNIIYCSLPCYQSETHTDCSEGFYKEWVLLNLKMKGQKKKNEKQKMAEMLQKIHDMNLIDDETSGDDTCDDTYDSNDGSEESYELDSDDDEDDQFADRMKGIDLDNSEEVWKKLNDTEKKEFEAFLRSGDVSKYIIMWRPWWEYRCNNKLVEVEELEEQKAKCPKIQENIPPFCNLCSTPPAPWLEHNLMNVVGAYAFTLRYFNGDHFQFCREASSYLFDLCLTLKKNQRFDSFNQAINSVTTECANPELQIMADQENLDHVKCDVHMIMSGPHGTDQKFYLLSALSDAIELLDVALKPQHPVKEGTFYKKFTEGISLSMATDDQFRQSKKKLEFFLSYANDYYS